METLCSLAVALLAGLAMSRVIKPLKLPAVTAYLIAGILVGPYVLGRAGVHGLGFVTMAEVKSFDLISQVALGFIFNYHINNMFSIVPEVNFEVRDYFTNADQSYPVTDDYGYFAGYATDVQFNLRQFNLNIPVMVRYNPTPQIFVEAGAAFTVNLYADYAVTSDEYGIDQTLDDWNCASTIIALQFGAGYTLGIGNNKFGDIGARFVLDMTKLSDEMKDTKTWSLQFFVTGYTPM